MIRDLGYRVYYYDTHADRNPKVIHETQVDGDKIAYGKIEQSLSDISTFEFELTYDHKMYNKINDVVGLVKVVNKYDNEVEFYGRILKPEAIMSSDGLFSKNFICESVLGYLQDSTQHYQRVTNTSVEEFLRTIIDVHNQQVEAHKRFNIGRITVKSSSDVPYRYIGYTTTFDTIKDMLIAKLGGYIQFRIEDDGLYLDYLAEVGETVNVPIQLGTNLESARKEVDLSNLITRLVPVGADKHDETMQDEETGQYILRERVTIDSVNGGVGYVEDRDLIRRFGIIQRPVEWTEIHSEHILLQRARQYMRNQKIAVSSWNVDVVELYLIDPKFKKYKLGNTHPIDNPILSGIESLQIIKKVIDVTRPESVELSIGADNTTLSKFQLQQQEANKSIEKLVVDNREQRKKLNKDVNTITRIQNYQFEVSEENTKISKIREELSTLLVKISNIENSQAISDYKRRKAEIENSIREASKKVIDLEALKTSSEVTAERAKLADLEKEILTLSDTISKTTDVTEANKLNEQKRNLETQVNNLKESIKNLLSKIADSNELKAEKQKLETSQSAFRSLETEIRQNSNFAEWNKLKEQENKLRADITNIENKITNINNQIAELQKPTKVEEVN